METGGTQPDPSPAVNAEVMGPSATPAPRVPQTRPPRRGIWIALIILIVGGGMLSLLALVAVGLAAGGGGGGRALEESHFSGTRFATDKIAILRIEGLITDGEGYEKKQIETILDDKRVKAIVLRVNSPGGTVSGSDFIYHHLTELRDEKQIPLVVSMGAICASGGYYVSMAVGDTPESIFAEPTTWTGSIGVIIPHYDVSGLLEEWHIQEDSIKSHPLKQLGSITQPMSEEERAILQSLVNDSFARFKEIVKSGRPHFRDDEAALDEVATGAVFSTNQSLENGLVDREGFLEDAIDRAAELAGLDADDVNVVEYKRRLGLMDTLFLKSDLRPASLGWHELLERATPRAYYLFSWLPNALAPAR